MAKGSKSKSLPPFDSLDDLVEFFETHDLGDYWEELPAAEFEVDLQRRAHLVTIDAQLAQRLAEIARTKQMSSEELINAWLSEKISERA